MQSRDAVSKNVLIWGKEDTHRKFDSINKYFEQAIPKVLNFDELIASDILYCCLIR